MLPAYPQAAVNYAASQEALAYRTKLAVRRLWDAVRVAGIDGSWQMQGPRILAVVSAAQLVSAEAADPYLDAVLAELGIQADRAGTFVPEGVAGVASDGRDLQSLLTEPVIGVKTALKQNDYQGVQPDIASPVTPSRQENESRAMASQGSRLEMLAQTMVQDAGRLAVGAALAARPHVTGHVRMLTPPSCSRCAILAGRFYRWSDGFRRHPRCFPAGTVVSGPFAEAATRRWYEGELVVLRTASGKELSATGNHPILTDRGWVPANLLQEGDHVVSGGADGQGARPLVVPDEHQMPARIEDLWRSGRMGSLRRVPTAAEDFHGDGGHGEVDVVLADGLLRHDDQAAIGQGIAEEHLARRVIPAPVLLGQSASDEEFLALAGSTYGGVRGGSLSQSLLIGHLGGSIEAGLGSVPDRHACGEQSWADARSGDIEAAAQAVLALSDLIGGDDFVPRGVDLGSRWDAPALPFSMENAGAYAGRGLDLLQRFAGNVTADRVVELRRVQWSGHVYNLSSVEGWYNANGLIVSNCDCVMIPADEDVAGDLRTDPKLYFESLSKAEQDRVFTKAGAESVRLGADMGQVVNARRGAYGLTPAGARITNEEAKILRNGLVRGHLQSVELFGRDVHLTTEGTTRRGFAGKRLGAWSKESVKGGRYQRAKTARLMPETILEIAEDRADAVRLLKRYGYVI